ncbi:MAG: hypothetical protein ABI818_04570 [Acidobacteriota bacterium]
MGHHKANRLHPVHFLTTLHTWPVIVRLHTPGDDEGTLRSGGLLKNRVTV